MTTRKDQDRRYTANHIFGLAMSMNLLAHGLQRNVSQEVLTEDFQARLQTIYATMRTLGKELSQLASDVWGLEEEDDIRDTKVGF